jgi:hypothetical protein
VITKAKKGGQNLSKVVKYSIAMRKGIKKIAKEIN